MPGRSLGKKNTDAEKTLISIYGAGIESLNEFGLFKIIHDAVKKGRGDEKVALLVSLLFIGPVRDLDEKFFQRMTEICKALKKPPSQVADVKGLLILTAIGYLEGGNTCCSS